MAEIVTDFLHVQTSYIAPLLIPPLDYCSICLRSSAYNYLHAVYSAIAIYAC